MSTSVIARNRSRMYTAFIAEDGRRVLNIATTVDGRQQCVSIAFSEADEVALSNEDAVVIERLLESGARIVPALQTPSASVPVAPVLRRAA